MREVRYYHRVALYISIIYTIVLIYGSRSLLGGWLGVGVAKELTRHDPLPQVFTDFFFNDMCAIW